MPLKIEDIKTKGYERVIHATNETTKLDCIIVIHNTKLGPALGGVRSWEYSSFEDQKRDALRLSEAMTLKNSICGINFGGGKAALNLKNVKKIDKNIFTKSGLMVGLGENKEEILQVMDDLRSAEVDFLTIGQYLQPSVKHHPLHRYYKPEEFEEFKTIAKSKGFLLASSSPLTRSSYHADKDFAILQKNRTNQTNA